MLYGRGSFRREYGQTIGWQLITCRVCLWDARVCRLAGMQEQLRELLNPLQGRVADQPVRYQLLSWRALARTLHGESESNPPQLDGRFQQDVPQRSLQQIFQS